jgi:RND family efflux transporter MFP subunit
LKYLTELFLEKEFASPEKDSSPSVLKKINKAQREYERAKRLYADSMISKDVLDQIKMNYELVLIGTGKKKEEIRAASLTQAEIDAEIARMKLEKTKIKAPFSGAITNIRVSPQEFIIMGSELFMLVDIHKIKVEAKVLESEIGKIKEGQEVDLRFSAYPDKIFKGKVKAISPVVHPEYKTCRVIIYFPNPKKEIKPGMLAEVRIAAEIYRDRVLIPQEAVLVRGGRKLVFAVEEGLAKWRYIEVGVENEHFVEVLDGVVEGEMVITEGHFTLAHDMRVEVVQ